MSVNRSTHPIFIFHISGSVSLIHHWIVFFVSSQASSERSLSFWMYCLNFLNAFNFSFRDDIIVTLYYDWSVGAPEEAMLFSLEENFGFLIRADLLFLTLAC